MREAIFANNLSTSYLEALYEQYVQDASTVDKKWQWFFSNLNVNGSQPIATPKTKNVHTLSQQTHSIIKAISNTATFQERASIIEKISKEETKGIGIAKLIKAYRERGHLVANINPIAPVNSVNKTLELEYFGLEESDRSMLFNAGAEINLGATSLTNILTHLKSIYCATIGYEFVHCNSSVIRQWFYSEIEGNEATNKYTKVDKHRIYKKIVQAHYFEQFLQRNYVGQKRFSLEGLEVLIPALDKLIYKGAELGVKELVMGMAHRGRLNVLVNIFGKRVEDIFSEFEGDTRPKGTLGDGDVKYHLGQSVDISTDNNNSIHLSMAFNPSHLEAINPIVQGIVYAKSEKYYQGDKNAIVPVLVHGDAAVAGQGIVYECNNMASIEGYANGGIIHIVLNNQIGFTAEPHETRSSLYCTNIACASDSPVMHVNADDPVAVVHCMEIAIKFRQKFGRDVWIDIVGYRRYGHNESDEPRFTQPKLYKIIDHHKSVKDVFVNRLIEEESLTTQETDSIENEYKNDLKEKFTLIKSSDDRHIGISYLNRYWEGLRVANSADFVQSIDTSFNKKKLDKIATTLTTPPDNFVIFSKVKKLLAQRKNNYFKNGKVEWAMAELLAYGSLLVEKFSVRLSGQDSKRGTFSHRHACYQEVNTGVSYIPLNHIEANQRMIYVYNSPLSEYGVLGFEYGYSLSRPKALTIWEAQFGDFANGAQIIIDQFIATAESKWMRFSGLVLLLPHGYEGQGPEHSSARIERFLALCAENNMYVTNPTTAANFFHLIRRQVLNPFRKPLIVFTPKSLLRNPQNNSPVEEITQGRFQEIIDDVNVTNKQVMNVKRIILCTGKIYYELDTHRKENNVTNVAIIRIEQLYPFCAQQLDVMMLKYKKAEEWLWVQEEPINMGAWPYMLRALNNKLDLKCIARNESMSTATGMYKIHVHNQKRIIENAFANLT